MSEEIDAFANAIAGVIAKHPALSLSAEVEESHVVLKTIAEHPFGEPFYDTWNEYNHGLFDSIRRMVRYERSSMAWDELLKEVEDGDLKNTITVDYLEPVFRSLVDLYTAFKDQTIKGSVMLAILAREPDPVTQINNIKQGNWPNAFKARVGADAKSGNLPNLVNDLYSNAEGMYLRGLHGNALHDTKSNLIESKRVVMPMAPGLIAVGIDSKIQLSEVLQKVKKQRLVVNKTYDAFDQYARALEAERYSK